MASAQLMTCFSLVTMAAACSFNASSPNFGDGNELMLAAKCNDVTAAKRLIVTSNINEVNAAGSTALHFAAFYDSVGVAEILLDKEADVNLKNNIGWSALIYAAKYGHTKIGTLLLENKADLNLQNKEGWSALMEAARYGHTKIGTMLVDNKADLNLQDKDGWTALMDAARYGHTKIGTLLVEKKAEVNLQTINGWSALMFAARYGHTKIGTLLVENKADVNIAGASGGTALLVAVEQGHLKIAEDLVEHGADVNAQGLSGKTSLMKAAQKGDKEMVKYLIDKAKASVFPISGAGATAQQMAADSFYDKFLQKKTLASRLQSPSLMQKLHYMVFDTFCLQYLLVGICVGGIVGGGCGCLPRANASEQDPFRDGSEYLALQALAAKEPCMNRSLQLLRGLEVFSQILLPFAVVMLFIRWEVMACFFLLFYVLPVLCLLCCTGCRELLQKPFLLPVQMIFTQRDHRCFRIVQVVRTVILLAATFVMVMWLPVCHDSVYYLLGNKKLDPKGPTAWLLAESPWPLLNPAASQLACPDVSMLPQDSKDLLFRYTRIVYVLSSCWVLATCLDLCCARCAFSHPPLEDDHSFRDFTEKILETRSAEEVKNLKFEKFEERLEVQPLKALKFCFPPSGLYSDMLMSCADFFLDVLQLFTWMNAFQFKFSGCMACIMSLSLVLQIRERKGCSIWMEDLEEACEASLQRGILRADLFKVLQIEQCVEAPLSLCLTSYAWIFGISSSNWWALIFISLPCQALSIKSLAGFVHVYLDWPDLKRRRHVSNASYLVLEQRAP